MASGLPHNELNQRCHHLLALPDTKLMSPARKTTTHFLTGRRSVPSLADPEKEVAVRYLVAVRIVIEVNDLKDAVLQPLKPGSPKENAERSETWAGLWDSAHNLLVNLEVPEAFAQAHPVLVRGVSGLASGSRDLGRAFRDSAEPSRLNEIAQEIFDSYESVQDAINLIADEEVAYFPPGGLFNSMNNPQPCSVGNHH